MQYLESNSNNDILKYIFKKGILKFGKHSRMQEEWNFESRFSLFA